MKNRESIRNFDRAIGRASKDDFSALEEYVERLRLQLRLAAQGVNCSRYHKHVEGLLISTTLGAISSWYRPHRAWSQRLNRTLRAGLPKDLYSALLRLDHRCRNEAPRERVSIHAPSRWGARKWWLIPVPPIREKRKSAKRHANGDPE